MLIKKVKNILKENLSSSSQDKLRPFYNLIQMMLADKNRREALRLYWKNYDHLKLNNHTVQSVEKTLDIAKKLYGDEWNYYSDALRKEVSYTFQSSIEILSKDFKSINYLEIGSAKGLSMSVIGASLKSMGIIGNLYSVDPYYDDGYVEGGGSLLQDELLVNINKRTKQKAYELYEKMQLNVNQIELTSKEGLVQLIKEEKKFHLIYIDGYHEDLVPIIDFGLSCELICSKGIIMLDDHMWEDIKGLKQLCDKYLVKVFESWKVVAYQLP